MTIDPLSPTECCSVCTQTKVSNHLLTVQATIIDNNNVTDDFGPINDDDDDDDDGCLPSVTELFRSPLLVSGTVRMILLEHLPYSCLAVPSHYFFFEKYLLHKVIFRI